MKRLLKIKEFFHLKKRALVGNSDDCSRPAKRPRKASKLDNESETTTKSPFASGSPKSSSGSGDSKRQNFLDLFEDEVAKDIVWWLPGRRREAFALNRERFEREVLRTKFQGQNFATFLGNLNRWGFRQMNIPSLSGRVLTFELSSQNVAGWRTGPRISGHERSHPKTDHEPHNPLNSHPGGRDPHLGGTTDHGHGTRHANTVDPALLGAAHLQQAQLLIQHEMTQHYVALLWQELQRQLTVLLLQQGHLGIQTGQAQSQPQPQPQQQTHPTPLDHQEQLDNQQSSSSSSAIVDIASLLYQQQLQQQVAAANLYQVQMEPARPVDQQTIAQELNELHQQQLSTLTYQIVALVAANLEGQNQNPEVTQLPSVHKILVKYLIALVLLQLQQQQHNLEVLRQERQAALSLLQSLQHVRGQPASNGATRHSRAALEDDEDEHRLQSHQFISSVQMQQLLADAAMLSLSRVHQLLIETAGLIPPLEAPAAPRPNLPSHRASTAAAASSSFPGARLSPSGAGPPAPRTTTAR